MNLINNLKVHENIKFITKFNFDKIKKKKFTATI